MWHVWRTGDVYTRFWWGGREGKNHFEDPGVDWRIILKWVVKKWDREAWTGLVCLRIGTGGEHL